MDVTEQILREFRTIAVVGLSRDPSKAAHAIPARMQRAG
jgi:predicted CoA-binding protein